MELGHSFLAPALLLPETIILFRAKVCITGVTLRFLLASPDWVKPLA